LTIDNYLLIHRLIFPGLFCLMVRLHSGRLDEGLYLLRYVPMEGVSGIFLGLVLLKIEKIINDFDVEMSGKKEI